MPELTNISTLSKGAGTIARDAAYVAVGLGVLGYQRAQVQRHELQSKLAENHGLEERLSGVRREVKKGVLQLDQLVEQAAQFLETTLQPLEQQLPTSVTQITTKAKDQAREVRTQIRQRVATA